MTASLATQLSDLFDASFVHRRDEVAIEYDGIYGVVSFTAAQRTREIGIRVALGANPRDVVGLVLQQGVALVAGGIVIGVAALALWACYVPARRARRVDPMIALRHE